MSCAYIPESDYRLAYEFHCTSRSINTNQGCECGLIQID